MAWLLTLSMLLTVFSPLSAMAANPFSTGQCTWWAYKRWTQLLGYEPQFIRGNAGGWYDNCTAAGFEHGSEPRVGAIACWNNGYGDDTGHVAIVEEVNSSSIKVSEYNWAVSKGYSEATISFSNINRSSKSKPNRRLLGYIYLPGSVASNNLPNLCVDVVQGWQNHIYVKGWAFDPDTPNAKVAVHVYINNECHEVIADKYHDQELDDTFHCGTDHGFALDIPTDQTGEVNVSFYAIDEQDANQHSEPSDSYSSYKNPTKVTITSDKTGPTITNAKVTNVDSTGYTVTCTVTDASGVNRVQFPTWTEKNGQDDLLSGWEVSSKASGTRNGNTFTFRVKTSDHNNESGVYHTHIYAYDNSYRGNCAGAVTLTATVPVPTVAVTGVRLDKTSLSFTGTGSCQILTATVSPSNATNNTLTWSSSNTSVATVFYGVVEAVGFGTATITAKSNNGKTASCTVTVNPIQPTGIKATPETSTLYGLNSTVKLSANVMPSNATNKAVTWSSRNTSVATVSSDGTVKAVGYGTTVITAKTVNGLTSNCTVTVNPIAVTGVSLNKTSLSFTGTGSSQTLTATVSPSNATNKTLTWSSSNTSVATVSNGVVKAVGFGTATITAKSNNGKTASCSVTVNPIQPTGIKATPETSTLYGLNSTVKLSANVMPSNATNKAVTWSSRNTSVATVSSDGTVKAVGYGTTVITATTVNGLTSNCTINVKKEEVTSLTIATKPTKTNYYVGDTLNTAGLTLKAAYNNGTTQTITGGFTCTPTALSTAGTQTVTVNYGGKTATFTVNVQDVTLSDIAIASNPTKTSYYVGDTLDATGLKIKVFYNSGASKVFDTGFTCTPTTLNTAGTQTITVSYKDATISVPKTATFDVTVQNVTLSGIVVASKPSKVSYFVGDTLDTTGLKLTATYNNGTTQTITSGFTCTPTALTSAGAQTVTVNYGGKTATFTVNVQDVTLSGIAVASKPSKTSYFVGDTLDTTGLKLTATYNNGTTQTITGGFTCTPTALSTAGTQTVTVNYGGKTATFTVNVQDVTLSDIAIASNPTKTSYYVGDTLDTTGLKLTATYNNGTTQTITSGFTCDVSTLSTAGVQTVTVNYGGKTATFTVSVELPVLPFVTLTFDPTDGVLDLADTPEKTVYPGEAYGRLPEPTADGMVFLGWYTESGKRITSLTTCDLTGDATVSARWALASAEGWSFDEATGTLTLDGSGAMKEYTSAAEAPWYSYRDSIAHLVVKSGVTSLSSYAFVGCQNLADITLPDTLQTIGTMTFYGCDNLNNVTIPASVRTIGSYAFADALSLSRITFAGDAPEFGTGVFTFRKLTAYYPVYASGWETVVDGRYDFGGSITWVRSSESLAAEESVLLSAAEPDDVLALDWTL